MMSAVRGDLIARFLTHAAHDDVMDAAAHCQVAIDALLSHPLVRRPSPRTITLLDRLHAMESHATAALAGVEVPYLAYADTRAADSPMSVRLRAASAVDQAARVDAHMLVTSPPRALGAWHVLASVGAGLAEESRGRPMNDAESASTRDELNAGIQRMPVSECVSLIMSVAMNEVMPAVTAAAVMHALLAAGQPFASDNALLGRAAARGVLAARGSDPDGLLAFNTVLLADGRPTLVRHLRSALSDGRLSKEWLLWHAAVLSRAARYSLTAAVDTDNET